MRGLSIRCSYAAFKVNAIIFPERHDEFDYAIEIYIETVTLGHADFYQNNNRPPIMFRDEPTLIGWWKDGYRDAALSYEAQDCDGCNNELGNPCPTHDR